MPATCQHLTTLEQPTFGAANARRGGKHRITGAHTAANANANANALALARRRLR